MGDFYNVSSEKKKEYIVLASKYGKTLTECESRYRTEFHIKVEGTHGIDVNLTNKGTVLVKEAGYGNKGVMVRMDNVEKTVSELSQRMVIEALRKAQAQLRTQATRTWLIDNVECEKYTNYGDARLRLGDYGTASLEISASEVHGDIKVKGEISVKKLREFIDLFTGDEDIDFDITLTEFSDVNRIVKACGLGKKEAVPEVAA